jgi:predicted amino acid racemase
VYETATLTVDLTKIRENTARLVARLGRVRVVGVTKAFGGSVAFGRALLGGGATALADSRLADVERLAGAGLGVPLWLIRSPALTEVDAAVALADGSCVTEVEIVAALAEAAARRGVEHRVVLMIELGDVREGILPDELPGVLRAVRGLDGVRVHGLGGNFVCLGGALPTVEKLSALVRLRDAAAEYLGYPLVVSGANSAGLGLALSGELPAGVDELRVGESIIGGRDEIRRAPIEGLHQDAVVIRAPVIEAKRKRFEPEGPLAEQVLFSKPRMTRTGTGLRVIVALGQLDTDPLGLTPLEPGIEVVGGSSDHTVLDATDAAVAPKVGDVLSFSPSYAATVRAYASPYVRTIMV